MQWTAPRELVLPFAKFNPNHDEIGRFASAPSAAGSTSAGPDAGTEARAEPNTGVSATGTDPLTRNAQWRRVAQGESRAAEAERAAAMPWGKRFTGIGKMTDAQWADHHAYVQRQLTLHGGDDTLHSPMSTHISEDMVAGAEGVYNDHRRAMQNQILATYDEEAKRVPNERKCIMTGGPAGAGKSTILRANAQNAGSVAARLGIKYDSYDEHGNGIGEPNNYVVLSPDDISEDMARNSMIPKVDTLDPMERATFVHEEASYLTKVLGRTMLHQGKNVIWDFTMSSPGSIASRMKDLDASGYHTAALFVDVSPTQSRVNAEKRSRWGHEEWTMGKGEGGRTAPAVHVASGASPMGSEYQTKSRASFEKMKHVFDQTITVDNENYAGRVIATTGKNGKGIEPEPVDIKSADRRELKVGDQVEHLDGPTGMTGTVTSLPRPNGDNKVGVYWIRPGHEEAVGDSTMTSHNGTTGIHDKHPARHLIKIGEPVDAGREAARPGERLGAGPSGPVDTGLAPLPNRPVSLPKQSSDYARPVQLPPSKESPNQFDSGYGETGKHGQTLVPEERRLIMPRERVA